MNPENRSRLTTGLVLIFVGFIILAYRLVPGLRLLIIDNFAWPFFITAFGLLLFVIGIASSNPEMAAPAVFFIGLSGILYWQKITGNWTSWAYTWTLFPGFIGFGQILAKLLGSQEPHKLEDGLKAMLTSALLFLILGQVVTEEEAERFLTRFKQLLEDHSICLFCGSGQSPLLEKIYAQCIEIAKENQAITLLDSSGKSLTNGIAAKPYLVKVNVHELSEHFGRPLRSQEEQLQALSELCRTGIHIAALSRGEDGLLLTDGHVAYEARLKMDSVLNVVGCGDSTLAGIAKAIKSGCELSEIARWGVACGTANTQRKGAGFIDLDLAQSLLPRVKIFKIELD